MNSTACLTRDEYIEILEEYPGEQNLINKYTDKKNDLYFVHYYDLFYENQSKQGIANTFKPFDVYELSVELYERVAHDYWKKFANQAIQEDSIYVFECCFLQNPFTKSLAKHNVAISRLRSFIAQIDLLIKPLNPVLFYFYQEDVRRSFRRVYEERSDAWKTSFTNYHTRNGYGKENGLKGFDGLITYLEMRKDEELKLLSSLDINTVKIKNDTQDWNKYYDCIKKRLTDDLGVHND